MRIGHGFDVHKLVEGRPLILGGVEIPHTHGLLGHSDADVVIHALCDAILGALGLGDIGRHFPDNDPQYQGVDSRVFLRAVKVLLHEQNYRVGNADISIVAQAPKLAPFIEVMQTRIADDLQCEVNAINIKATTTEALGYTGRKEGIACHAVALLAVDETY